MSAAEDETAAAEVLVEGRVQGVGFREFARRCAGRLGVVGYAMNLRDGRVRLIAEGTRAAIESLVAELERGPRLGNVGRVTVTWQAPCGEFTGFGIRDPGHDA